MPWPAHCHPSLTPADEYDRISVTPIAGALGAEISGVDISRSIDDATFAEIRRAWTQNLVIFFRGQSLRRCPGRLRPSLRAAVPPSQSADRRTLSRIVRIHRKPGDKQIVGEDWHPDTTCMAEPPCGAVLYGVDVQPVRRRYALRQPVSRVRALSDGMKALLSRLTAVHSDITRGRAPGRPQQVPDEQSAARIRELAETVSSIRSCALTPKPAARDCSSTGPTRSVSPG